MASTKIADMTVGLHFDTKELKGSIKDVEKATTDGYSVAKNVLANLATQAIQGVISKTKELVTSVIDVGMTFEAQMSKVEAISGATAEEMVQLNDKAREMGRTTKFTAEESGQAFEYMAMAGWKTEEMLDGIEGIMNLSAASGVDLARTSDIVTDALTAFGLEAKDAGHFADVLAVTSANANTNVDLLGESFKYVAPVAGSLGFSIEDTAVALGLAANAGIKASQAGTSLRQALVNMIDPTDSALSVMEEYGIALFDSEGNSRELMDVMTDLRSTFGNFDVDVKKVEEAVEAGDDAWAEYSTSLPISEQEKLQALTEVFGVRALPTMLAIINSGEQTFEDYTAAINDADGAAQEMAETMMNNLAGSITILKSQWADLQLALYQGDYDGFRENFGGMLESAIEILKNGIPLIMDGVKVLFDTVIKELPTLVKELLPSIIDGLIDIALGLVEAAPDLIQIAFDITMSVFESLVERLPEILDKVVSAIIGITDMLTKPDNLNKLLAATVQLFLQIVRAIPRILTALIQALPQIINNIVTFLTDPGNIGMIIGAAIELFFGLVSAVPQILSALLGAFGTLVGNLWAGITDMFTHFADNFGKFIGGIFKGAINGVLSFIESFINAPINIINGFIDIINGAFGVIGVDIGHIDLISLPRLAQGGLATGASTAIIGEAGTEAVLPLERNTDNWSGLLAAALAEEFDEQGLGTGERVVVNFYDTTVRNDDDIKKITQGISQVMRRQAI